MESSDRLRREVFGENSSIPVSRDNMCIEFLIMRADGRPNIGGLNQINSHIARDFHKKRRMKAEVRS